MTRRNIKHRPRQRSAIAWTILCLLCLFQQTTTAASSSLSLTLIPTSIFFTFLLVHNVTAKRPEIETHEDVIASREKRRRQLERVLENAKKKLDDDRTGVKQLSDQAKAQFEKKIPVYEHQLAELARELDEEEINRILENSRKHQERLMGDEL